MLHAHHNDAWGKVIETKYSKHWPYTVAHTIDCVCSKMLNHGLNHGLFLSLFKLIPCHIHLIVLVLGVGQRYTYRVLQTIQMKVILLSVWAEGAVLGRAKTALKFKYKI